MLEIQRILFPTDYSACAEHAFSSAVFLAERHGAELYVLHVREEHAPGTRDRREQRSVTSGATPETGSHDVPAGEAPVVLKAVDVSPVDGSVSRAILAFASEQDIDLIVMGTHGRSGVRRLVLGSVADRIVQQASCPVLTVRERVGAAKPEDVNRILVPVDFSEHAQTAVAYAVELAEAYGASLCLLHVVEQTIVPSAYGMEPSVLSIPDVEEQARDAVERLIRGIEGRVPARGHVFVGNAEYDIASFAERQQADLIVMATHGATGLERFLMGSTAETVVRRAPCPVFTVKSFGKSLLPSMNGDDVAGTTERAGTS